MKYICVVFFDVSKAFDKVPHLPLIQQLQELYVDPYLIRWLIDYLSNRYQFVAVDGETSKQLSVVSGVPQGSVLGPLLFILYINNISTIISPGSELNMFADDVALYRIINSVSDYTLHCRETLTPFPLLWIISILISMCTSVV